MAAHHSVALHDPSSCDEARWLLGGVTRSSESARMPQSVPFATTTSPPRLSSTFLRANEPHELVGLQNGANEQDQAHQDAVVRRDRLSHLKRFWYASHGTEIRLPHVKFKWTLLLIHVQRDDDVYSVLVLKLQLGELTSEGPISVGRVWEPQLQAAHAAIPQRPDKDPAYPIRWQRVRYSSECSKQARLVRRGVTEPRGFGRH